MGSFSLPALINGTRPARPVSGRARRPTDGLAASGGLPSLHAWRTKAPISLGLRRTTMRSLVSIVIFGVLAACGSRASADFFTFDISGLSSDREFVDAFPTLTHDFGVAGTVVSV